MISLELRSFFHAEALYRTWQIPLYSLLTAINGTPLQDEKPLEKDDILRTIAIFRFLNPKKYIRIAGGRRILKDNGRAAFLSGANAAISGNYLTTAGYSIAHDRQMLSSMGLDCTP